MFARVKCIIWVVIFHVGFKSPILSFFETWRRRRLSLRNHLIVDEVFIVSGRPVVKFPLRHPIPVVSRHGDHLPMEAKIQDVIKLLSQWKGRGGCSIVLGLQKTMAGRFSGMVRVSVPPKLDRLT